jgi:hypothetical protein
MQRMVAGVVHWQHVLGIVTAVGLGAAERMAVGSPRPVLPAVLCCAVHDSDTYPVQ